MIRGRWLAMSLSRALLAALLSAAAAFIAGPVAAQQLRVAVTSAAEGAPFFAGMERGLFAKAGLDVKVDVMPSGVEFFIAVARWSADVGLFGT
jgi:ABC-type nitrate/sulfonate/bicarbonate transport system substrate-binding protein